MTLLHFILRPLLGAVVLSLAAFGGAPADALERPQGEILLTVSGAIGVTNAGDAAVFDLAMLEALEQVSFATTTIWTDGVQEFTGVSLRVLMDALQIEGATLKATAINDYTVEIPASDAIQGGPIIAYYRNGQPMSIRDKGPLWVVYPYDQNPDYKSETIYARSIWQLDRMIVQD